MKKQQTLLRFQTVHAIVQYNIYRFNYDFFKKNYTIVPVKNSQLENTPKPCKKFDTKYIIALS